MMLQCREHAHGRFVELENPTIGKGHGMLMKTSAFWIKVLEVWVLSLGSFYLAKYVAIGFALVAICMILINEITHLIGSVSRRSTTPACT